MGLDLKIIFSPSKEMRDTNIIEKSFQTSSTIFEENTFKILNKLKTFSKIELSTIMKIKGEILEKTFDNINNYKNLEELPALSLYNGVAFKELELESYDKENFNYIKDRLYILSAFYGLSKPFTLIKKYRLDMTMKIFDISPYDFWKEKVNAFIEKELETEKNKVLLNLASGEFSKLIDKKRIKNIINIDFKEYKDNKYTSVSSYSKQARGAFLNIMIKNKIKNIEELKNLSFNGYKLNSELSNDSNFIFTR